MKFGVFDHMDSAGVPLAQQYEERLRLIEAYERAGFHCYHLAEHHATPLGMAPVPGIFLAAVAQRTRTLRFGPLVYPLSLYHPLRVVEEICMLDHLSGGRLVVGVGRGASPHEMEDYGVDPKSARDRYFETFEIVIRALQTQRLTFAGRFHQFRDIPIEIAPLQRPHPPLWYGVVNAEGATWAAANAVNIVSGIPAAALRKVTDAYRATWAAADRGEAEMPLLGMNRYTVLADTDDEALTIARRAYHRWYRSFIRLWEKHGTRPIHAAYPDNFDDAERQGFAVAGAPARVRAALTEQLATSGANYLVCRFAFGDLMFAESTRALDLFAREVMPALAA
jgi:alkanesulfonate monooxygenase SsuD/methylene tetrahydromethanopterin reductase-like flavin-dependent oxidoreductase (luciferase family)